MSQGNGNQCRTPVALLIFNRPDTTARVFEAVRQARPERLLIVADGPRPGVKGEAEKCAQARAVTEAVDWPCEVLREYSEPNLGCRLRVSSGIDWIFEQAEEAIILEDDCVPDPSFFGYCEELLERYRDDERVMHISGDNLGAGRRGDAGYYFSRYPHIWGWASWRRAWAKYDVNVPAWASGDKDAYLAGFERDAERNFWRQMWDEAASGRIGTWDFQWVFACIANGGLAINPNVNLVSNIGYGEGSTHTEEDPTGIGDLPTEPVELPLRHPATVARDSEADAETGGRFFTPELGPLRVSIDARLGSGRSGGVEQVVIGLAAALSELEGEEEYLFLTHEGEDDWITAYLSGPCRVLHTRRSRPSRRARAIARGVLERLPGVGMRFAVRETDGTVERNGAGVVHFPFQDAFSTGVPSIYQPHDLQHLHLPSLFGDWQRRRRETIYRFHCERATTVVMMSSWGRDDLIAQYGLPPEKVAVVPGGSVLETYPEPSPADLEQIAAQLALPEHFLLYPAQPWPHKNHTRLLEALALLRDREGLTIPLVCSGGTAERFSQVAAEAGRLDLGATVHFPGFVSPVELATGRPSEKASQIGRPQPSNRLGKTRAVASRYSPRSWTGLTNPGKRIVPPRSSRPASAATWLNLSAVPPEQTSGIESPSRSRNSASASSSRRWFLWGQGWAG
jgi:glycosyltransferase involved in cell wall biosynthesis